jgi:D-aminopeptidase
VVRARLAGGDRVVLVEVEELVEEVVEVVVVVQLSSSSRSRFRRRVEALVDALSPSPSPLSCCAGDSLEQAVLETCATGGEQR